MVGMMDAPTQPQGPFPWGAATPPPRTISTPPPPPFTPLLENFVIEQIDDLRRCVVGMRSEEGGAPVGAYIDLFAD